jgi:hypothetical protein
VSRTLPGNLPTIGVLAVISGPEKSVLALEVLCVHLSLSVLSISLPFLVVAWCQCIPRTPSMPSMLYRAQLSSAPLSRPSLCTITKTKCFLIAAASTTFSLAVQSYPQVFPPTLPSQFRHSQLQPPVPPSIPPAFGSNVPPAFPPSGKFNLLGAGLI